MRRLRDYLLLALLVLLLTVTSTEVDTALDALLR